MMLRELQNSRKASVEKFFLAVKSLQNRCEVKSWPIDVDKKGFRKDVETKP
jgi:hypothetical protein